MRQLRSWPGFIAHRFHGRLLSTRSTKNPAQSARVKRILLLTTAAASAGLTTYYLWRSNPVKTFDPFRYSTATVTSHTRPTPLTSLLRIRLAQPSAAPSPFYALYAKSPDVQVERPYTPLRGLEGDEVELWIKHEHGGEVSRYLGGKNIGDEVEVRGWSPTIEWSDQAWDRIIMISGGTGIAPFYQLLHHLFLRDTPRPPSPTTQFVLLHGSTSPSELPPPSILLPLCDLQTKRSDVFSMHLFVDNLDSSPGKVEMDGHSLPLHVGYIGPRDISSAAGAKSAAPAWDIRSWFALGASATEERRLPKKILFLVCGPEPMVEAFAGPRARDLSEGDIGGLLGRMGYGKGQVRKL